MNRIVSEWVRKGDQGENNRVYLTGRLSGEAVFHHRNHGQRFYQVYLETRRKSGYTDRIPVLVPEFLLKEAEPGKGGLVEITGKFRSFSKVEEGNYHVLLKVAAATLVPVAARDFPEEENHIFLNGYICKQPVIRSTPLGRLIADFILAVNRESFRTDYIPCICWGRTARFAAALMVGEKVHLYGRIQSREYTKKTEEEKTEVKTAYEVSVTNLELV
ncbi:MAG: single-stranded DNA-binding protein [Blautia sp.]|nr:single-stranded DNA-binding protein [Blautia sp.]